MRYSRRKFFILSLSALLGAFITPNTTVFAQEKSVKFSSLSINDGLSQSDVKCILKDRYGFMWFSTDDGLNRYDGYNFVIYRHDPKNKRSLPVNDITVLLEDSSGNLWIGTSGGGLSLYDRNSESFTNFASVKDDARTLSSADINSIFQDKEGNIWVGTYSGLNLLDKKTRTFRRFFYTKNRDDISSHHIRYRRRPCSL
jgi:ligand-binding sensor domain-containing protein